LYALTHLPERRAYKIDSLALISYQPEQCTQYSAQNTGGMSNVLEIEYELFTRQGTTTDFPNEWMLDVAAPKASRRFNKSPCKGVRVGLIGPMCK
jgi:hypothetical protein